MWFSPAVGEAVVRLTEVAAIGEADLDDLLGRTFRKVADAPWWISLEMDVRWIGPAVCDPEADRVRRIRCVSDSAEDDPLKLATAERVLWYRDGAACISEGLISSIIVWLLPPAQLWKGEPSAGNKRRSISRFVGHMRATPSRLVSAKTNMVLQIQTK